MDAHTALEISRATLEELRADAARRRSVADMLDKTCSPKTRRREPLQPARLGLGNALIAIGTRIRGEKRCTDALS